MNYIVFDLEWNQSFNKETSNPKLNFEIIEIGAVRLNEKYNIVSTYQSFVKPRVYRKLQQHIKNILNYDEETLMTKGKPFDMVAREFFKWCKEDGDYTFCSWGPLDLSCLQNNMDYFYMKPLPAPVKFYDIQKIFGETRKTKLTTVASLEYAVNELNINIEEDKPFHTAVYDAYYTAKVLKAIKPSGFEKMFTYDTYNPPLSKDTELRAKYKDYSEYITQVYESKRIAMDDEDLNEITCYKCNRKLYKKISWFTNTQNNYTCIGKCFYHGVVEGRIHFKQVKNTNNVYAVKTMKSVDKHQYDVINARKEELRIRRRDKLK